MLYIAIADVTDKVINAFNLESPVDYIALADEEMLSLAEEKGVDVDNIAATPHKVVRDYLIAFLCARVALDKFGVNDVQNPENEKYFVKYKWYDKRAGQLRQRITQEMVADEVDLMRDRVTNTGLLFRG